MSLSVQTIYNVEGKSLGPSEVCQILRYSPRKTGRHIKSVSRDSGGFEIFDQMMVQAYTDGRKPKPVVKYKVKPVLYDENNQDLYEPEEGSDDEPNEFDQPRVSHDEENEKLYGLGGVDDLVPERASLDEEVFNFPAGEGDGEEVEIEPIPHEPEQTIRPKRQKKEVRQLVDFSDDSEATGLRRSKRRRYAPLEYWRQERVVWGRRENGRSVVPVIKEIITIPKPEPEPLGTKKRRRGARKLRSKSLPSSPPRVKEEIRIVEVDNPELGWDDATPSTGVIIDWTSKEEVERRGLSIQAFSITVSNTFHVGVAYPAHMVDPKPAQGCDYFFHKIFGDGDFIAAGQLVIPPGAEKPTKPTKDNTYVGHGKCLYE